MYEKSKELCKAWGLFDIPSQWLEDPNSANPSSLLKELEKKVSVCKKCGLSQGRKQAVFGVGNANSPDIAFVGEGPGADEDRLGEPFVGRAGKLLTKAITQGLKISREDVYICNIIKCRPPGNRNPVADEVIACMPWLENQLAIVRPRTIVLLGSVALKSLLGPNEKITKARGQWREWKGIRIMPTYHPAYILRNPSAKKYFWEDLQCVMKELGW